ncbi:Mlp family lipoprotein [Borrelia puertoricensis]|uniref:Mlp family lipoprotein n=1 Tax=Borrelia puertoricensis TaxID=2756107 RepID=UPI001FF1A1C7|nr:Mlp family lipoprotein [Borrelia puertoricensis]UPA18711.1 Mlp family lipoprotein [Borrelia puertoricensis]
MNKINFILILLLLISSCEYEHGNATPKSRSKRDLSNEREQVEKTPEDALREKLNDSQKQGLEFLKDALSDDNKLNEILKQDERKVKDVLEHIKSELEKCTGDNANDQKNTFKTLVKEYFKGNNDNLDNIVGENSQLQSMCGANGAGG